MPWWVPLLAVAVGLFLLEFKTSRSDGTLLKVHPYRRLMGIIFPTRNESVVYFDDAVDAEKLLAFLERTKDTLGANMTHAVVAACNIGHYHTPSMNRFVMGRRIYQRKGRAITFSLKRQKLDKKAQLSVVKLQMDDAENFASLCRRMNEKVGVERSGKRTSADLEYAIFNALPRGVLQLARHVVHVLDYYNLLPAFFIEGDGLYTSTVVANLGSIGMPAGYHHLYEWGNASQFVMVGQVEQRAVVRDGAIVQRPILPIRYSYDERVDDGLNARFGIEWVRRVLEDPDRYLGERPLVPAEGSGAS
jgi:hypothetical protein